MILTEWSRVLPEKLKRPKLLKKVGPCHHGMARPQVADGGTASRYGGSCEYIEQAVADSRQGVVLQLGGWARCYQLLNVKKLIMLRNFTRCLGRSDDG
jgi:hypothetical protein